MGWKQTALLRAFGLAKVPILFFISPSVITLNRRECVIKVPLNYRTKNHLGCMYFGVLAAGADCAGGQLALEAIRKSGKQVDLIFKDFKADFLKRAEADAYFTCSDGARVIRQVKDTIKTGRRVNRTVTIVATTPDVSGHEPVARFHLTLSLKVRPAKARKKAPAKQAPVRKLTKRKAATLKAARTKQGRRKTKSTPRRKAAKSH